MTELHRVMPNEVPASETQPPDSAEHLLSFHRPKVLLFIAVGAGGEAHPPFDDRDSGVAQMNFVTGVNGGPRTDGGGVVQIGARAAAGDNIGVVPYSGVIAPVVVVRERIESTGSVVVAGIIVNERL